MQKQAAAEPTYNTALIVKVVFEMTADYMVLVASTVGACKSYAMNCWKR